MIRIGIKRDKLRAVMMAKHFIDATPIEKLPFDAYKAGQIFDACIESNDCLVLVLEIDGAMVGTFIGECQRFPLGNSILAREVIFWIEPDHRGAWATAMIDRFEVWARAKSATRVFLTCFDDGRTPKLFARRGYKPAEITMSKEL